MVGKKGGGMLLFSTMLAINEKMDKEDFIRLVIEWNQNSPHKKNVIPNFEWRGKYRERYGNDTSWMEFESYNDGAVIACRYENVETDGTVWNTDYIVNFKERKLAVRLDRSFDEDAMQPRRTFMPPFFISNLIRGDYLEADGEVPISEEPIEITHEGIDRLIDVINQKSSYCLPVIYVSRKSDNELPVNVKFLAKHLKGVAHVFVEANKSMDSILRERCNDRNEYNGTIGVYYPSQTESHRRFFSKIPLDGYDEALVERVIRNVVEYSNAKRVAPLYTWEGIKSAVFQEEWSHQRQRRVAAETEVEKTRQETDELLDMVSQENDVLKSEIERLTRQNEALTNENHGFRTKLAVSEEKYPILFQGNESEIYPNEIREMVLDLVCEAKDKAPMKSRRRDVYTDILECNGYKGITKKKKSEVKRLFSGYSYMSPSLQQGLKDFGLAVEKGGKHYKISFPRDDRYWTTISQTGSDHREGKNIAARIIRDFL